MKYTPNTAMKKVQQLRERIDYLRTIESQSATYIMTQGVETTPPTYDMNKVYEEIQDIENTILQIKHALNVFNVTTVVPETELTVDQALVRMAQLSADLRTYETFMRIPAEERISAGYLRGVTPDIRKINYDIAEAQAIALIHRTELMKLQTNLDLVNATETFEV